MENLNIVEIRSFVPAKDYELSKRFYQALGFEMPSDLVVWRTSSRAVVHSCYKIFMSQNTAIIS